jgi:parallel beta-helix repeat protein
MSFVRLALALAAVLLAGPFHTQPARAAESYDNCAGTISSLPAVITTQGVWCLKSDLSTNITSGYAIAIQTNNVTVDCNDFKLGGLAAGNGSAAIGIYANNRQNTTVRHCNVRGFYYGIDLYDGAGQLVEDNRLDNNLNRGIIVTGENDTVRRNRVYDTGGASGNFEVYAITADASVIDNEVSGVFPGPNATDAVVGGIQAFGLVARGNRVSNLTPSPSGFVVGIDGTIDLTSAIDNLVSPGAVSVPGIGIENMLFSVDNISYNLTFPRGNCTTDSGNLP